MATPAVLSSTQISTNRHLSSPFGTENWFKLRIPTPNIRKTSSFDGISLVQASLKFQTQRGGGETRASNEKPPFIRQEDLKYVAKLGGGSVVGAAAIKYGSIVFPEITRPNVSEAMIMISAPVLLAVMLLIIRSRAPTK